MNREITKKRNFNMNIQLLVVQGFLALVFLLHGILFLVMSPRVKEELKKGSFTPGFGRFIGGAEVLAAFGLILPGLTGILPWLTPLAAIGLFPIMVGALVSHLKRNEWPQVWFCLLLIILITFVVVMRVFVLPL
jgi:uncharacterized membrane protein YphA (DoxX/SURF4 family)